MWKLWSKFSFSSNPQDCFQLINDTQGAVPEQKLSNSFSVTFCSQQLNELPEWLINNLPKSLTPQSKVLLEQSTVPFPVKKSVFYGTKMFTVSVIRTHHLPSYWVRRNLSTKQKTRNSYNLHPPLSHLTKYKRGVHYASIWVFNHLPTSIKSITNETKIFKNTLKKFLMDNSFYSMGEFLNFKE
jgi:hypothetical protein